MFVFKYVLTINYFQILITVRYFNNNKKTKTLNEKNISKEDNIMRTLRNLLKILNTH